MSAMVLFQIISFIAAICVHEAAHAFTAYKCGDTTAYDEGRVSLNPLNHLDPFGTVVLPIILLITNSPFMFGWAKPVPIDPRNLNDPKTDEYWISLAGPLSNFSLAVLFGIFIRLMARYGDSLVAGNIISYDMGVNFINFSMVMISTNLILCIFNLIPIPPLDGFNVLRSMLPDDLYENINVPPGIGFIMFIVLMTSGVTDTIINAFYSPVFHFLIGQAAK